MLLSIHMNQPLLNRLHFLALSIIGASFPIDDWQLLGLVRQSGAILFIYRNVSGTLNMYRNFERFKYMYVSSFLCL